MIGRFLGNRRGTTSIEYAVIGCLVSLAVVTGATGIGTKVNAMFLSVVRLFP